MPILSVETLPWILLACVVARSAWLGARLATTSAELRLARERLASVQDALEQAATRDSLTSLPNRDGLDDMLARSIADAERGDASLALLFLDLDQFKRINEALGHAAGDRVLQEAARRISAALAPQDFVARFEGDAFAIVVRDPSHADGIAAVAADLTRAMQPLVAVEGHDLALSCRIGVATWPQDGHDPRALVTSASRAMFEGRSFHGDVTKHSPPCGTARTGQHPEGLHAALKDAD